MAEISYPFAAESAGGGTEMVSQLQWQNMARMWAPDRIDFQITNPNYTLDQLPFYVSLDGSGNIVIQPGSAWVGGFYYKLDAPLTLTAPFNASANKRTDIIVLRADMTAGSVNLAVVQGQPASAPVEPSPTRSPGGVWEMALWTCEVPAAATANFFGDRRKYDVPSSTTSGNNGSGLTKALPYGSFNVDMAATSTNPAQEFYNGRDGVTTTRTLGTRFDYTPDLLTVSNKPSAANRKGWYRTIAPGSVSFQISLNNTTTKACNASSGTTVMATTLPFTASKSAEQHFVGYLANPDRNSSVPNAAIVIGRTKPGTNSLYLLIQSWKSTGAGLDGVTIIPAKSDININGVYETTELD